MYKTSFRLKILREGRRGRVKNFYITGHNNVEHWGIDGDTWSLVLKTRILAATRNWCGMKLCKKKKLWSIFFGPCADEKEKIHFLSSGKQEETSQLDYTIGPVRRDDALSIHNEEETWTTWDHNFSARIYSRINILFFQKEKKEVDCMVIKKRREWKKKNDGQEHRYENDLDTFQGRIMIAAGKVAHHSYRKRKKKNECTKVATRCPAKTNKKNTPETSQERKNGAPGEMPLRKESRWQTCMNNAKNFKEIVKKHTDQEEPKEAQESRIEHFNKKGNQQFCRGRTQRRDHSGLGSVSQSH